MKDQYIEMYRSLFCFELEKSILLCSTPEGKRYKIWQDFVHDVNIMHFIDVIISQTSTRKEAFRVVHGVSSWVNVISAPAEALRNLTNWTSISNIPSMTYTHGVIHNVSSTGEFATLSCLKVQSSGHSSAQNPKSGTSTAATVVDETHRQKGLHQSWVN